MSTVSSVNPTAHDTWDPIHNGKKAGLLQFIVRFAGPHTDAVTVYRISK